MIVKRLVGIGLAVALAGLTGCGSSESASPGAASPVQITPSATPTRTPTPTPKKVVPTPTPTPTPNLPAAERPTAENPLRVELWGDSISAQAAPYIRYVFGATGKATVQTHTYAGTALCNWSDDMRSELDPNNAAGFHPQVAIIQFSGDAFTSCMKDANGVPLTGQTAVEKYAADSAAAITIFSAAKVPIYFLSTPMSRVQSASYTNVTPFGVMFSQLPKRFPAGNLVRYIDTATPLELHGKFSLTLPCAKGETCTGTWADGTKTVIVRQSDGTHFCPAPETVAADGSRSCPVHMPGAQRFALSMLRPISRDFGL